MAYRTFFTPGIRRSTSAIEKHRMTLATEASPNLAREGMAR